MSASLDLEKLINLREQMQNNIESRRVAEGVFKALLEVIDRQQYEPTVRFWETLHKLIGEYAPERMELRRVGDVAVSRMPEKQAVKFEKVRMPFGEYAGKCVKDVPLDRLEWYAQQDFVDRIRSYLLSRRVREEMEGER